MVGFNTQPTWCSRDNMTSFYVLALILLHFQLHILITNAIRVIGQIKKAIQSELRVKRVVFNSERETWKMGRENSNSLDSKNKSYRTIAINSPWYRVQIIRNSQLMGGMTYHFKLLLANVLDL